VRKHLIENTANFDPRKFLKEATNAMSDICAARFEAFGSAGNADKIKVSSLDTMSQRYTPMRAGASAASVPACPPPITITG
jgi:fructose-bisphosphate aldolase class II